MGFLSRPSQRGADRAATQQLSVVVPFTGAVLTQKALEAAAAMAEGLHAAIVVVMVKVVPFPATMECPSSVHRHMEAQLHEIAARCPGPVEAVIVLARDLEEGYRQVLDRGATVVIATPCHWWRTREEKLARRLRRQGYNVAVVEV